MDPASTNLTQSPGRHAAVIFRGVCRGALVGALVSLPVAVLCGALCRTHPAPGQADAVLFGVWMTILGSGIAGFVGGLSARVQTAANAYQELLRREIRNTTRNATILALPVVVLVFVHAWEEGPWSALIQAGVVIGVWIVVAAEVGHDRGLKRVDRLLQDEAEQQMLMVESAWMEGRLEKWSDSPEHQAVQQALEARFGPLGPETRVRLGTCSEERLREIERTAGSAESLHELGLED
jgi:hypothetical protein